MATITTRTEETSDVQRILTTIQTKQAVDAEPAISQDLKSYRLEYVDAVWTLVEEKVSKEGQKTQTQVDGSISSDPLETHLLFSNVPQSIKDNWLKWKVGRPTVPVAWDPSKETNTDFAKFYSKYKSGFEVYYAARIVVRMTELEDEPADCTNLGKIETPKGDASLPQGINFILLAARGTQEGALWRNTYEWLGSAPMGSGWDALLYS